MTSLFHRSLAEIIPDPNPLLIRRFVAILATIACPPWSPGIIGRAKAMKYCVAVRPTRLSPASLLSSYQIRKRMAEQNYKTKLL